MPKKKDEKVEAIDPKDDSPKKASVFDVAKPGSTPAEPSSRSIIVGHGSMLKKDPFLSSNEEDGSPKTKKKSLPSSKEKKLAPLNGDIKPDGEESSLNENKATKPVAAPEAAPENPKNTDSGNSDAGAIDALADEADAKAKSKEDLEAEKDRDETIQPLIDSRKYYLPITEGGKKAASERIVTWLLIFLLIAAAGAWLLIDAGYLDVGIDLPYSIIKD